MGSVPVRAPAVALRQGLRRGRQFADDVVGLEGRWRQPRVAVAVRVRLRTRLFLSDCQSGLLELCTNRQSTELRRKRARRRIERGCPASARSRGPRRNVCGIRRNWPGRRQQRTGQHWVGAGASGADFEHSPPPLRYYNQERTDRSTAPAPRWHGGDTAIACVTSAMANHRGQMLRGVANGACQRERLGPPPQSPRWRCRFRCSSRRHPPHPQPCHSRVLAFLHAAP
jgi:hypothetical protein